MNQIKKSTLLILLISTMGFAQFEVPSFVDPNPGDEVFAAPEVMAFQKQNFLPIDLYTGKVQVGIPIHEISVGRIKVPINLSYNSGGVKVDDVASSVGLGWSLNAGGNILKVVRDIDDLEFDWDNYTIPDDTGDNAGSTEHKLLVAGYHRMNSTYEYTIGSVRIGGPGAAEKKDSSPDTYIINAPGLSTEFYLKDTNPGVINSDYMARSFVPVFLDKLGIASNTLQRTNVSQTYIGFTGSEDGNPGQTLSIDPTLLSPMEDFNSFSFTNANGLTYTFNSKNVIETRQLPVRFSNWYSSYDNRISSWNLNTIYDPSTDRQVTFEYQEYQRAQAESVHNFKGRLGVPSSATGNGCFYEHMSYDGSATSGFDEVYSNETLTKYTKLQRISRIVWDGGSVEFVYGANRSDAIGEKALTEIVVKDLNNNEIKRYVLEQSYFISKEGCSDAECKRLKLDRVKKVATDGTFVAHDLEYDYANPLPRRNSLQKDYLGYYNNNGSTYNVQGFFAQAPSPKLYFYPDQGIHSILPFRREATSNFKEITGDYGLLPNTYSLTGLLKKITYPTGGYSEFEYENHRFQFMGWNYTTGGVRIKKQRLNDANGQERILEYEYVEDNGKSSGYVNNFPVYGYPNKSDIQLYHTGTNWTSSFTTFDKARSGLELTHGAFVGYARVIEKEVGNGSTEYLYTSPKDYPNVAEQRSYTAGNSCADFLIDNSAYPGLNYTDNDRRRGKLRYQKIYDESGQLLQQTENQYQYVNFESLPLSYDAYMLTEPPGQNPEQERFSISITSEINTERYLGTKTITDETLVSGTLTTIEERVYDTQLPFIKESIMTDSKGLMQKKKFKYINDFSPSTSSAIQNLHNDNRLAELIELESWQDGSIMEKSKIEYALFPSGLALPSKLYSAKGSVSLEERLEYQEYDNKGNLLQLKKDDLGSTTSYIWGHNQMYPVAKVENASYSQIEALSSFGNGFSLGNGGLSTSQETTIHNSVSLPEAMVTTYVHRPLVGMTRSTDPRGLVTNYIYDAHNRLGHITDQNNHVVKKYEYNYEGKKPPEITIQIPLAVQNSSATITTGTSGGSGNFTYSWKVNGQSVGGSSATLNHSFTTTGSIPVSVKVTDNNTGSYETASGNVTVYPPIATPTVTASKTYMLGGDSSGFSTSNVGGGSGNYTYKWYINGVEQSEISNNFTNTFAGSGSYTVKFRVTDQAISGHYKEGVKTVHAYDPLTTPGVSSNHTYVLKNSAISFSTSNISGGSGNRNYQWYVNSSSQSGATSTTYNYTPTSAGTYNVKFRVNDTRISGHYKEKTRTVYAYNSLNTPTISSNKTSVVNGTAIAFNTGNIGGGSGHRTYEWYVNNIRQSGSGTSFNYTPSSSGSYTVKFTVRDSRISGHARSVTKTVHSYNTLTTPNLYASKIYIIEGNSINFTTSGIGGGSGSRSYEWYVNNVKQSATGTSYNRTFSSNGTYTVKFRVRDNLTGQTTDKTRTVYAYNPLNAGSISASSSVTVNTSAAFNINPSGGGGIYTYAWTVASPWTSYTTSSKSFNLTMGYNYYGSRNVMCKVTDTRTGATQTVFKTVTVGGAPTLGGRFSKSTINSNNYYQQYRITAIPSNGSGNYTYKWYLDGSSSVISTANNLIIYMDCDNRNDRVKCVIKDTRTNKTKTVDVLYYFTGSCGGSGGGGVKGQNH